MDNKIRRPIAIINKSYADFVNITYEFTNVCNYKCSYCWPDSHAGSTRWPDFDKACDSFDHLISVYKQFGKKTIRFHLLGGEPTLWPRLGEFAKFIYDKHGCRITIVTNGSRTARWWDEYSDYFDDIQISVHHEFCNVDHIREVLDTVYQKQNSMIAATVMMDPKHWDKCKSIVDQLTSYGSEWLLKVKLLRDPLDNSVQVYSKEQLLYIEDKVKQLPPQEFINRMKELNCIDGKLDATVHYNNNTIEPYSTFSIMNAAINQFTGWKCMLMADRVVVNYEGKLQGSCNQQLNFNINDPLFKEKFTKESITPVICEQKSCSCQAEVKLTKYNDEYILP